MVFEGVSFAEKIKNSGHKVYCEYKNGSWTKIRDYAKRI